jgi:hypothetical protein
MNSYIIKINQIIIKIDLKNITVKTFDIVSHQYIKYLTYIIL